MNDARNRAFCLLTVRERTGGRALRSHDFYAMTATVAVQSPRSVDPAGGTMNGEVGVKIPDRVWATVVDFEPFPPGWGLTPQVRQRLRDAVIEERPGESAVRVVRLSSAEALVLENWLVLVCARDDAPPDCFSTLELVRRARAA